MNQIQQAIEALQVAASILTDSDEGKQASAALASLRAVQEVGLPPLPEPDLRDEWTGQKLAWWSADLMQAYARTAIAAAGNQHEARIEQLEDTIDDLRKENSIQLARIAELEAAGGGVPHGYKLVPIEPTWEMLEAALDVPGKPSIRELYAAMLASSPQPEAAQLIEWTDKDGVKHRISINGARELLHKFYDEWPGGWSEVEAEQRARAEAAPAVAQVPQGWKLVPVEPTTAMINAGQCGCMDNDVTVCVYKDMLAAAPEAPAQAKCRFCGGTGQVEQYTSAAAPRVKTRCPMCAGNGICRTPKGCDQHGCHGGCLPAGDGPTQADESFASTTMALIEDYAKAVHDGDDAACEVLRKTIEASLEQMLAQASQPTQPEAPAQAAPSAGEVERDRKDAERYRWLRDVSTVTWRSLQEQWREAKDRCDARIDAALSHKEQP